MTDTDGLIDEPATHQVAPATEAPKIEAAPEPVAETPAEPQKSGAPIPEWVLPRINEETNKRRAAEENARLAAQRAADAEALLARLQQNPAATTHQPSPQAQISEQQFNRAVAAAAAEQRFMENVDLVRAAGAASLPDFTQTIAALDGLGVDNVFLDDLFNVDRPNAHLILDKLAKDPNRAIQLSRMNSRQRTVELTRLSMAEQGKPAVTTAAAVAAAKPAAVSKAPPPKPAMEALSTPVNEEFADELNDAQWGAAWDKKYLKRA